MMMQYMYFIKWMLEGGTAHMLHKKNLGSGHPNQEKKMLVLDITAAIFLKCINTMQR